MKDSKAKVTMRQNIKSMEEGIGFILCTGAFAIVYVLCRVFV